MHSSYIFVVYFLVYWKKVAQLAYIHILLQRHPDGGQ